MRSADGARPFPTPYRDTLKDKERGYIQIMKQPLDFSSGCLLLFMRENVIF
jgi:hypothetical protein